MKINRITDNLSYVGLFLFLVLISISYLTTNDISRQIVVPVRLASIAGIVIVVCAFLVLKRISYKQLTAVTLYVLLTIFGILLSVMNGAFEIGQQGLLVNILVTLSGVWLFSIRKSNIIPDAMAQYYFIYILSGLCITIVIGGINLSFPPHFILEYNPDLQADQALYSQGISKFYGFGAIAAAYLVVKANSKISSLFWSVFVLIFLASSLLGGARGDSLIFVMVVSAYLASKLLMKFLLCLLLGSVSLYFYVDNWSWFADNFIIIQRLSVLGKEDYGYRDIFLEQALNLLFNEPRCLVMGCGFGYFQSYYGSGFGSYPHNFLVEFLIMFGLPLTLSLGVVAASGVRSYYRKIGSIDLFLLFFASSILIGLKGGTLFGGWFLMVSILYFATLYIQQIRKPISDTSDNRNNLFQQYS